MQMVMLGLSDNLKVVDSANEEILALDSLNTKREAVINNKNYKDYELNDSFYKQIQKRFNGNNIFS